jgi:hypothetical protein
MYVRYLTQVPPDAQTARVTCSGTTTVRPELSVIVRSVGEPVPVSGRALPVQPAVAMSMITINIAAMLMMADWIFFIAGLWRVSLKNMIFLSHHMISYYQIDKM